MPEGLRKFKIFEMTPHVAAEWVLDQHYQYSRLISGI